MTALRLSDLLDERSIRIPLTAAESDGAIEELLEAVVRGGRLEPSLRDAARRAVLARERQLSTGMGHGVAIPHGSVEDLPGTLCAIGTHPTGIPFGSMDGSPARLVVLMLVPRDSNGTKIGTLAGIARILHDEGLRRGIVEARSAGEVLGILSRAEAAAPAVGGK